MKIMRTIVMVTLIATICNMSFVDAQESKSCCSPECQTGCKACYEKLKPYLIFLIDIIGQLTPVKQKFAEAIQQGLENLKANNAEVFAAFVKICKSDEVAQIKDKVTKEVLEKLQLVDENGNVTDIIKALVRAFVPDPNDVLKKDTVKVRKIKSLEILTIDDLIEAKKVKRVWQNKKGKFYSDAQVNF